MCVNGKTGSPIQTDVGLLQICGITGIEAFLLKAQLQWAGHVMRIPDDRIPKQVFCGQLAVGTRPQCGPVRRYKDSLKETMKKCRMQPSTLSIDSQDRSNWKSQCQEAVIYIISYHMLYYDIRQNADEITNITKYSD